MKFQYTEDPSTIDYRGRVVKRPVITLELRAKDGSPIEVEALIDSGADITTVHIDYANFLDVELGERCDTTGISEDIAPGYLGKFPFTIKDMGLYIEVVATYVDSENVPILLGREGFFDAFRIVFEQAEDSFELIEQKSTSQSATMD
jgi:hypothetical protein